MPATTHRPQAARKGLTYADAGVSLEEKDAFTESLGAIVRRTHGQRVIPNPGGFAGLFRLDYNQELFKRNYKQPVLIACADGCGTKPKIATALGRFDTIGIDLVAMNVNDLIVQGGEPLFFLDYIAVPKVNATMLTDLVRGMAEGCKHAGCALLGGETAEMPDVYPPGEFDLAGFAVGVVELKRATQPTRVQPGDVVLGLESDGVHCNGYSLVRKIVDTAGLDLNRAYDELTPTPTRRAASRRTPTKSLPAAQTLGEVLLTPTRIYAKPIVKLQAQYKVKNVISGMAHITGSGMAGNLERALHKGVDAIIDTTAWQPLPIFRFLQEKGDVTDAEMRRVFNMGIGYCLIVRRAFADSVAEQLRRYGERVHTIGEIVKGQGLVRER